MYFEAVVIIIALILVGNALEARAKGQTAGALRRPTPSSARSIAGARIAHARFLALLRSRSSVSLVEWRTGTLADGDDGEER